MAEKKYKCLNPTGMQDPVDLLPLAPRLRSLDGKTVHLSICGEPDVTIALEKRLRADYPNVNWTKKKTYGKRRRELPDDHMVPPAVTAPGRTASSSATARRPPASASAAAAARLIP